MHYAVRRVIVLALVATMVPALVIYHRDLADGYDSVKVAIVHKTGDLAQVVTGATEAAGSSSDRSLRASELSALHPPPEPQDDYIAACLAVKNQSIDLPEWLHHHYYHMGIGRFFIMDDGSQPPLQQQIANLTIPREKVEFYYYPPDMHIRYMQYKLYGECIKMVRNRAAAAEAKAAAAANATATSNTTATTATTATTTTEAAATYTPPTWMAFYDTDEFLDAHGDLTLRQQLEIFEPIQVIGGFGVNWRVHTSDGNLKRPPTVLGSYFTCATDEQDLTRDLPMNRHIKSIVRVSAFERAFDPHSFVLRDHAVTVGELGDLIGPENMDSRFTGSAFRMPITRQRFSLHHYATKSRAEYEDKMNRGSAMSNHKGWDWWEKMENHTNHTDCREMLRWARPPS